MRTKVQCTHQTQGQGTNKCKNRRTTFLSWSPQCSQCFPNLLCSSCTSRPCLPLSAKLWTLLGQREEESSTLGEHVAGVAMTVNVSCTGALPRLCLKVAWPQKNPP